MIPNIEQIKEEYRSADFNRRLHLYLQFPSLRSKFLAIDQSELNDQLSGHAAGHRPSLDALLSVLIGATAGCFKRFS